MTRRLKDRFSLHDPVEIYFVSIGRWVVGRVVGFDPPGIWVETAVGQRFFVTNTRRIRFLPGKNGQHE